MKGPVELGQRSGGGQLSVCGRLTAEEFFRLKIFPTHFPTMSNLWLRELQNQGFSLLNWP